MYKSDIYYSFNKVCALTDYKLYDNITERHKFRIETISSDPYITTDEKLEIIQLLKKDYDYNKVLYNDGIKRPCENCERECLATLYCEHCIRSYLQINFSNSGNEHIDDLIKQCQTNTLAPDRIAEWISFDKLSNFQYITKGGCSEIYSAIWSEGPYIEWDNKEKRLKRLGTQKVILKTLKSANRSWFDEAKSHLPISNKWIEIVQCLGLTQDSVTKQYFLVMSQMDLDLRTYLQQNYQNLDWKERIKITFDIINALDSIHREKEIHRDLHSGNILYSKHLDLWFISDFGFCGPVNEPLESIYGNLPYIAPEVIVKNECQYASDIYSIAMLMWEISFGKPPFYQYRHNYDLAMNIINGMRPTIMSDIPLEYQSLMEQCWHSEPEKRPKIHDLLNKIRKIGETYYLDENKRQIISTQQSCNSQLQVNNHLSRSTSYNFRFGNLTEGQEAFHSKPYDFSIPMILVE